jgi:deferrochelatase/peroxidase EfeB
MGEGSVTKPIKGRRSWKLKPPHDRWTQGMVVSGFVGLPRSEALFLFFDWPADEGGGGRKGAWLQTLNAVAPITAADGKEPRAAAISFTWSGLERLGLSKDALETFSAPFREGMYQEDRLRRLGDKVEDKWQGTVIEGGPEWSGNIPVRKEELGSAGELSAGEAAAKERQVITPKTVHALLLLYDKDEDAVQTWARLVEDALAPHNVKVVQRLPLELRLDENGIGREHFGFADGLSQPIPFGDQSGDGTGDDSIVLIDGRPAKRDPWHGVPLGDILLGHTNAHHEKAPGPFVQDDVEGRGRAQGLKPEGAPEGFLNFGLNGSYLVVRELRQDVAAFWNSVHDGAAKIRAHDPTATHVTAQWLAERIVGRNIDGHLLCPGGLLPADEDKRPQNDFGFFRDDPRGRGCPLGSHVRRGNPRDGLAKDEAAAQTLLDAANNHRILRRGRKYGTTIKDPRQDDHRERGLLFICLNTDIARQFEFVQQTWILNSNFATLFDETDPLVGPKGHFTIPEQPLRRIVEVATFIQMAGGEYFFLPSIPALNYLAAP